ncbi:MAG: sugar transferase [Clostridia bacterium]|nr:sugar transferase [Oscillospiraceae bacterium]MBQ6796745.1 sugar transferase [Clostridia bacterium]
MYGFFKRLLDIVMSFLGIIILSPVMIIVAVLIKLTSKGPVLFKQQRVGKNGKLFKIWKFRSMRTDTPKDMPTHMLENPETFITPVGRFIRKTSIDELPQLFNILAGQMSVIGPRPALANQTELLRLREENGSAALRPGLTGWAQINGRDELPDEIKAGYDGEYAQKISFGFDVKCFFGTIGAVLRSDGIVEGAQHKEDKSEDDKNDNEGE